VNQEWDFIRVRTVEVSSKKGSSSSFYRLKAMPRLLLATVFFSEKEGREDMQRGNKATCEN